MATNIEQIFRDFVMNKIKEIEDESQDKSHTDQVESNNGELHSDQGTGINKEAPQVDALSLATDKVSNATCQGNSGKEEFNTKHKKSKKHKKHKSKKKKKKHKEVKESSSESESGGETQESVKKKKRKKKKKHKQGEKGKKFDSQSGSSSESESESESEMKPLGVTAKTLTGKMPQDLPDIIPKLETASEKHKESKKAKRSSSRTRTSQQDKSLRRQRSRSSSGKQKTRHRSRSRSARRSPRSRSKSLSRKSPRRESTQKRWRSRSRSHSRSQRRNRRSRSYSARRGRHSRSRSRSRQNRSRSNVRKSRRSRSKSRSRSHHSRRSRSRGRNRHSTSSSRSKSRSFSSDKHPESERQKNRTAAEIKHDDSVLNKNLNEAENGDKEKSQTVPVNPSASIIKDGVINDGPVNKLAGSWKPIPFLDAGVSVSGSSETNPTVKCITPTMPLDMKDVSAYTSGGSGDLLSTEKEEDISSAELKDSQIFKQKSVSPNQRHSKSPSRKRSTSSSPFKRRKSRSSSRNSRTSPLQRKRSKSRKRSRRSKSKSPKRKRSKSHSPGRRRRSRTSDRKRSKSRHRSRSKSRRSRSGSRRKRGGFRNRMFSQRDRWKREPSHSPVVILRKKRSTSRTRRSSSKTPPRLTELDKEQLLEIAKANAAAMCAKAGMPIPESLRPKTILQLPLPAPNPTPLSLPLPLPVNLPMGIQGMSNMTMNAAVASMTAATMTAALSGMNALAAVPQLAPLPTITNKPPPSATPNLNLVTIEEAKKKLAKQANSYSIKELTEKCKKIAESKEEMAIAKPHVSDDEEDDRPFGGVALKENKGITFSLTNPSVKPAVRSEAAFAKEFPVSSGSQHRKKEEDGVYGEWMPVDKKTDKAGAPSASAGAEDQSKASDSVFPEAPSQPVDITLAISERAVAQKRLAENPFDINAMCMLNRAQEQVDAWAQSNTIPGLFTGSTGAQVLSSEELSNSGPQAWIKKSCRYTAIIAAPAHLGNI
ncbi:protein SON isoform X2 [Pangasianodon hypophthalmus]|uniref:protein SON isoform X2 n=1 Tax=Pangasianodon hypophthalmus TaxID=310915 RepID=UPI000EFF3FA1|nr:protein SON isoform X2 [Pangasianodon hypophthalmus]